MSNFWAGVAQGLDAGGKLVAQQTENARRKALREETRQRKMQNDRQAQLDAELAAIDEEFYGAPVAQPTSSETATGIQRGTPGPDGGTATTPPIRKKLDYQGNMNRLMRIADAQLRAQALDPSVYMQMVQTLQAADEKGLNQLASAAMAGASQDQLQQMIASTGNDDIIVGAKSEPVTIAGKQMPNVVLQLMDPTTKKITTFNPNAHMQSMLTFTDMVNVADKEFQQGMKVDEYNLDREYKLGTLANQRARIAQAGAKGAGNSGKPQVVMQDRNGDGVAEPYYVVTDTAGKLTLMDFGQGGAWSPDRLESAMGGLTQEQLRQSGVRPVMIMQNGIPVQGFTNNYNEVYDNPQEAQQAFLERFEKENPRAPSALASTWGAAVDKATTLGGQLWGMAKDVASNVVGPRGEKQLPLQMQGTGRGPSPAPQSGGNATWDQIMAGGSNRSRTGAMNYPTHPTTPTPQFAPQGQPNEAFVPQPVYMPNDVDPNDFMYETDVDSALGLY